MGNYRHVLDVRKGSFKITSSFVGMYPYLAEDTAAEVLRLEVTDKARVLWADDFSRYCEKWVHGTWGMSDHSQGNAVWVDVVAWDETECVLAVQDLACLGVYLLAGTQERGTVRHYWLPYCLSYSRSGRVEPSWGDAEDTVFWKAERVDGSS
jgi:hypothetical protein